MALAYIYWNVKILIKCPGSAIMLIPRTIVFLSKYLSRTTVLFIFYIFDYAYTHTLSQVCASDMHEMINCMYFVCWQCESTAKVERNSMEMKIRVRQEQGRGGWNLRWSIVFSWPGWLEDWDLQLRRPACGSTGWRYHQIMFNCQPQYPAAQQQQQQIQWCKRSKSAFLILMKAFFVAHND